MAAEKQYSDAKGSLDVIGREALPQGFYITYGKLAEFLGYDMLKYTRHIGQVCSLIDAACYWAKLPMLSLEKVRTESGTYNPEAFGGIFVPVKSQLIANTSAHVWTLDELKRIKHSLDRHMSMEAATLQWQRIESFGEEGLRRITSYK